LWHENYINFKFQLYWNTHWFMYCLCVHVTVIKSWVERNHLLCPLIFLILNSVCFWRAKFMISVVFQRLCSLQTLQHFCLSLYKKFADSNNLSATLLSPFSLYFSAHCQSNFLQFLEHKIRMGRIRFGLFYKFQPYSIRAPVTITNYRVGLELSCYHT
jgi:hypothetical protein